MTKQEQAQYLVNLLTLIESRGEASIGRGLLLPWEYERVYADFASTIRKEQEDEARKSADKVRPDEGRAQAPGGVTWSGEPDRVQGGRSPGGKVA